MGNGVTYSHSESSSLSPPEDPIWGADRRKPGASTELEGTGALQWQFPELTWCPTVFLCSLAVWPGLPLVGFAGVRVRGVRPDEVADVGLMAFSSS